MHDGLPILMLVVDHQVRISFCDQRQGTVDGSLFPGQPGEDFGAVELASKDASSFSREYTTWNRLSASARKSHFVLTVCVSTQGTVSRSKTCLHRYEDELYPSNAGGAEERETQAHAYQSLRELL
jgi:hypothetical protein